MRTLALSTFFVALTGCPRAPVPFDYDVRPIPGDGGCPRGLANNPQLGREYCASGTDVEGASLPEGFCIRRFASFAAPRVMAFAPNGDLFVSAPSTPTPGGATPGDGVILALSDDDHDGVAEVHRFAEGLPDVHGLAFGCDSLYYTTTNEVWRQPYVSGQRVATGAPEVVARFTMESASRWTHGVAVSSTGEVFATQGSYASNQCPPPPATGAIHRLTPGTARMSTVSAGYRNPLYMRCHHTDDVCLVAELGDDGGGGWGAHERIVLLRAGTNYGFPCCTATDDPTPANNGAFDCSAVPRAEATFPLNDTPFGLDWERGLWPAPYRDAVFVALHGSFYSSPRWAGTRVVFAASDPVTHAPVGAWRDFLTGFGPGGGPLERATDVAFAHDGRLFVADDQGGAIYWIAPRGLRAPAP